MYRLLFFPAEVVDAILKTGIAVIYKKYGECITSDPKITSTFDLLASGKYEDDDMSIKLMVVMFILSHEPELATAIADSYDPSGGFFEHKGSQMFRKLVIRVKTFVDQTLSFPYNPTNIVETTENFVKATKLAYMMGK